MEMLSSIFIDLIAVLFANIFANFFLHDVFVTFQQDDEYRGRTKVWHYVFET